MPYVRIEITDGATYEQKLQIYEETTEMLARILGKNPEYTFVVIEEVDNKNWGHKGTSVARIREIEAAARAGTAPAKATTITAKGARKAATTSSRMASPSRKAATKRAPARKT